MADFIAEFTSPADQGAEEHPSWNIYTDGSSNKQAGGAGIILRSREGDEVECMVRLNFPTTNNEAEYETLIAGLDLAKAVGATYAVVHCDSQIVTNQVIGEYECRGTRMRMYLDQAKRKMSDLQAQIVQIPRKENEQADRLAKAASAEHMTIHDKVLSFVQLSPAIDNIGV